MEGIGVLVFVLVLAVLIYIVRMASRYLTAKIDAVQEDGRVKDKQLLLLGLEVAEKAIKTVAEATVGKLEELKSKDILQKIANGEATAADLKAVGVDAYNEIVSMIQPEIMQSLSESVTDVEAYIKNQIENQLGLLKKI